MKKSLFLLAVASLLGFSACQKTGPRKACFKFSKNVVNPGDSVYVLNCSENYSKFIWVTSTPSVDSLNKHLGIKAGGPGSYVVSLHVGDYDMNYGNLATVGEIMIDSFKVQ